MWMWPIRTDWLLWEWRRGTDMRISANHWLTLEHSLISVIGEIRGLKTGLEVWKGPRSLKIGSVSLKIRPGSPKFRLSSRKAWDLEFQKSEKKGLKIKDFGPNFKPKTRFPSSLRAVDSSLIDLQAWNLKPESLKPRSLKAQKSKSPKAWKPRTLKTQKPISLFRFGNWILTSAVRSGNASIVKMVLDKFADINCQDSEKRTPLHLAIDKSFNDIAYILLEKKPNLELKNKVSRPESLKIWV